MKRRTFIATCIGGNGMLTVGCGGGQSVASPGPVPAPPAEPTTPSPPPAEPIASKPLGVSLGMLVSAGGRAVPFTVGHCFQPGQVPKGATVAGAASPIQCAVKSRWPDGSAKIAVLSGLTDAGTSVRKSIALNVVADSTALSAVSLADLQATGITASIRFGDLGMASWAGQAWATPHRTWISGPQMSSWLYRQPIGADAHLVAWLELRCHRSGQVELLAWLENGYLKVAAPGQRAGEVVLTVGATQRFSRTITLANHQRAVLAEGEQVSHWLGEANPSWPQHDMPHLLGSRLVPNYRGRTPSVSPLFARLAQRYAPLAQANLPDIMGSTGYHPSIGLLPEWDAAYVTTQADPRASTAVLVNACAAGRYGTHFRDEATQLPLQFSSHANLVVGPGAGIGSSGSSSRNQYTPAATGASPPMFASSHQPAIGYMAYLVSGWHYFVEEAQFVATLNFLKQTDGTRQFTSGVFESAAGANITRGAAWALRALAHATCITPDDHPLKAELNASLAANIDHYHKRYVSTPSNPLGLVHPYDNYNTGSGPWIGAPWMDDFFTATLGVLKDLQLLGPASSAKLDDLLAWKYRSVVGRLGVGSGAFPYPYAAQYNIVYCPSGTCDWASGAGPWYASWGEVAKVMGLPEAASSGLPLESGYPVEPTGYWGNMMPAISLAVDHGAAGAAQAWARIVSAPNFAQQVQGYDHDPVWGVAPR